LTTHITHTTIANKILSKKLLPVLTGKLLPMLFFTVIMVLYSRKLEYKEYGQFQMVWVYCNIISVIISFGLPSIILSTQHHSFLVFCKANKHLLLFLYTIGSLVIFTFFYFGSHQLQPVTKLLLIAFILLQSACILTDALLIKKEFLCYYALINFFYAILFFAIHLYFFYTSFILNQLIIYITCLSLLKASCYFFIPKKKLLIVTSFPINFTSNWFYIGVNGVAGTLASWIDKIFLLYLLSPTGFAIFFNGAFEIPLFAILISTLENILLTSISEDITNKKAAQQIFKESFKLLSIIAFPLFFFLLTMHAEAFSIIFNNKYNASLPVFIVSIFIIPVRITHYSVILQCYGQSKKIIFGSIMDIFLSILLMFLLYPLFGTPGVALAIVISTYLQATYYLWQSAKVLKVPMGELIPIYFLVKLAIALAFFYSFLYACKQYFSSMLSLILALTITAIIIISSLIAYLFGKKIIPLKH